jgi:uncharacterized UPF0160 family protein
LHASSLTVQQRAIVKWGFEKMDLDGDGFITRQEVEAVIDGDGNAKQFVALMDENDDGYISYEEWINFFTANPHMVEQSWGPAWRKENPQPATRASFLQRIAVVVAVIAIIVLRPKSVRPH